MVRVWHSDTCSCNDAIFDHTSALQPSALRAAAAAAVRLWRQLRCVKRAAETGTLAAGGHVHHTRVDLVHCDNIPMISSCYYLCVTLQHTYSTSSSNYLPPLTDSFILQSRSQDLTLISSIYELTREQTIRGSLKLNKYFVDSQADVSSS